MYFFLHFLSLKPKYICHCKNKSFVFKPLPYVSIKMINNKKNRIIFFLFLDFILFK